MEEDFDYLQFKPAHAKNGKNDEDDDHNNHGREKEKLIMKHQQFQFSRRVLELTSVDPNLKNNVPAVQAQIIPNTTIRWLPRP